MQEKEELYWYWLCNLSGIGNKRIKRLLDVFKVQRRFFMRRRKHCTAVQVLHSQT